MFIFYIIQLDVFWLKMPETGESKILFIEISPAIIYNDIEI